MRLIRSTVFSLFLLLCVGQLNGLPIQNPADPILFSDGIFIDSTAPIYLCRFPKFLNFQFGYYGDFVFDRKMKTSHGDGVHKTEIFTNAGYLALNICRWIEAFGTLGVTQIRLMGDQRVLTGDLALISNMDELETGSNFSWSAGGRLKLLEAENWAIGIEGQYFRSNPHVKYIIRNAILSTPVLYLTDAKLNYWEGQLGGGLSYKIKLCNGCSALIPYIGIKGSWARIKNSNVVIPASTSSSLLELKEDKKFGYAIGVTLLAYGRGAVTVEGRFLDEKALHVNMKLRF